MKSFYYTAILCSAVLLAAPVRAQTVSLHCGVSYSAFTLNINYSTNQISVSQDVKRSAADEDYTVAAQVSAGSILWTSPIDPEQPATFLLNRYSLMVDVNIPPVPGKYTGRSYSVPCTDAGPKI